jgi:phosphoenolpyruvate carboxykinase (GTP)
MKHTNKFSGNKHVLKWVEECAELCGPDKVIWTDGSKEQLDGLKDEALKTGELVGLDQKKLPGCVLHRTAVNDAARSENLTFICTRKKDEAGPTNNWMAPGEAYERLAGIFRGSMKGRTMYVIPFLMGPPGSKLVKTGVELTDSIYVTLNMHIMTKAGRVAWEHLGGSDDFTRCLHGKAGLEMDKRFICHFPEDNTIWSVGSGYGGNVLLGKKCLSLRLASWMAKREKWMADHMLIVGIQTPTGRVYYIAGAFPSACGKTNLAMIVPPKSYAEKGWKVWTISDDISWMRVDGDGQLWAVNAENGFFGVLPGTNMKTNPNAMKTIEKNTIYTNVLLKGDGTVWWEGKEEPPDKGIDWKGEPWTPAKGEPGANPNSRFTAPVSRCPSVPGNWDRPEGFPLSAILFGGRRAKLAPLVYESFSWRHGVFMGASLASERTAAQYGTQGEIRRDPMAMLPFCGYNMGDYFRHWLDMGIRIKRPPKIFNVNWFRTGPDGKFLWPGFGENMRVLEWIIERCEGRGVARETPIGLVPETSTINTKGLKMPAGAMKELLSVNNDAWKQETVEIREFFSKFDRLPEGLKKELEALEKRLSVC